MKFVLKWLLFLFCLFFILFFSSQSGSSSSELSNHFVSFFHLFFSISINLSFTIRKCAHFLEYFLLAIFTYSLFSEYQAGRFQLFLFTFLFCVLFAISDEVHQLFVEGRSGRIFDVFLDSCGSFLGTFVCSVFHIRKKL